MLRLCRTISGGVATVMRSPQLRNARAVRSALTLTPSAVDRVRELLKPDTLGLRVKVTTKGCNGLAYNVEYATSRNPLDEEVTQDGVKILIDSKALLSLLGSEMDYVNDKISSGFVFRNPNIKGACGCGQSFHV